MKYGIFLMGWLATAVIALPTPLNQLLDWKEPEGCTGIWSEECMGTAAFCATRDEVACLRKHKAPPHARVQVDISDAEFRMQVWELRDRNFREEG